MALEANSKNDDPRAAMEAARVEVVDAEREIQSIKSAMRALESGNNNDNEENLMKISVSKVIGLPETAEPKFKLQLSSPVEEITLTGTSSPSTTDENAIASFRGVETSVATITCEVMDADIPLGMSASFDVAPLCEFDVKDPKPKTTQMDVAIVPPTNNNNKRDPPTRQNSVYEDAVQDVPPLGSSVVVVDTADVSKEEKEETEKETEEAEKEETKAEETKVEETNEETTTVETKDEVENKEINDEKKEEIKEEVKEETATEAKEEVTEDDTTTLEIPICTVTLSIEFSPSKKDQMDAYYELLNTATKRKAVAIDQLRKSASAVGRSTTTTTTTEMTTKNNAAVKSGFLNKTKKKEPGFVKKLYEKTVGPQSMLRMVGPILKNYCLFFGAVVILHFRGNDLALPPPV